MIKCQIKVALGLSAMLALTSCSKSEDTDDNLSLNSLNENQSGMYGYCSQILAQGIFDDNLFQQDFHSKAFLVKSACNTFNSYNSDNDDRWSKVCESSSNSSGANLGIDAVIKAVPIGLDAGYTGSDSSSYCKDAGSRRSYRKVWYQNMCSSSNSGSESSSMTHQVLKSVNSTIVEAWKTCITQRHKGLTCIARKAGEGINFDINYDPDAFGADRVDLGFQYSGVSTEQALPTSMGRGNLTRSFKFSDFTQESNVIVTASANGGGQVSCDIQLPPQEPRTCQNGNIVGVQSGAIYETSASTCKKIDQCEINRLRAVFEGKIDWDMYKDLVDDKYTAYFQSNGGTAFFPCNN
jgi:hypothetical protein